MSKDLHPVTLSARAAEEIRKIMATKNIPSEYSLRVGIKGGGCGGVSLLIGFDKMKATDIAYTTRNIEVLVDKKHTLYVIGKEVDYHEGEDAHGFMFVDPASPRNAQPPDR